MKLDTYKNKSNGTTWVNGQLDLSLIPPIKGVSYTGTTQLIENILKNGNFSDVEVYKIGHRQPTYTAKPNDWTHTPDAFLYTFYDGSQYLTFKNTLLNEFTDSIQQAFEVAVSPPLHFYITQVYFSVEYRMSLAYQFKIQIRIGTAYYLDVNGVWQTSFAEIPITGPAGGFNTFSITAPNIPADGNLTIRISNTAKTSAGAANNDFMVKKVRAVVVNNDGEYVSVTETLQEKDDNLFTGEVASRDFSFFDEIPGVNLPYNYRLVFDNILSLPGGDIAATWGGLKLQQAIANRVLLQNWYARFQLNNNIRGKRMGLFGLIETDYKLPRAFYPASGEMDLAKDTFSGELHEFAPANGLIENAAALFVLLGDNWLINAKGQWADYNKTTGLITFPELTPDLFDKSDTTYWDVSIQTDLHYNAAEPREWYITEFTDELHEYATETTLLQCIWNSYLGVSSSVIPIALFAAPLSAEMHHKIAVAMGAKEFIRQEGTILNDNEEGIYQGKADTPVDWEETLNMRDEEIIVQNMDFLQEDNENINNQ